MYRMTTCEITYGPLNCDFVFRADNECAVKVLLPVILLSFVPRPASYSAAT